MARPFSYEKDAVLDAATDLFWARGYDGAGLAELLGAMGIGRGSLYKAWGSKRGLFLACLERYDALHMQPGLALLRGEGEAAGLAGAARIDRFLATYDRRGCLICNTAAGAAGEDAEVAAWVRDRFARLHEAFVVALRADGCAPDEAEARADRLVRRYVGTCVRQRAGADDARP